MTTPCKNIQVETSRESVEVTWPLPVFNVTSEGVIGRCDRDPGSRFFWGTVWVRCWAEGHTGSEAECHFTVTVRPSKCPMWSPPKNGALACDRWLFGQFCMVFCYQEFEFDSQPAQLYICGASGLRAERHEIRSAKFVDVFEETAFGEQGGCADNSDCRPENVAVFWGDSVEVTPPPTTTSIVTSTQMMQTNTTYVYDAENDGDATTNQNLLDKS
ncbi:Sushi, von Willebrand factor type A, EGF and pentraxin [Branchiostoma belcheri]|nr:Sushi, von Willebrand factor type A, EGF and pentraxin [Branchiostoma belcheri]